MMTFDIYDDQVFALRSREGRDGFPSVAFVPACLGAFALSLGLLTPAHANNECGAVAVGPPRTVTCNTITYTVGPNDSIQYPNQNGLIATISGVTVRTGLAGVSHPTGDGDIAVHIRANNAAFTGNLAAMMTGGLLTTGNAGNIGLTTAILEGRFADGIRVEQNGLGETSVSMSGGTITTYGYNAMGLYAWQRNVLTNANAQNVVASFSGASSRIETHGAFSHGVQARSEVGRGNIIVTGSAGSIESFGPSSIAIRGLKTASAVGTGNVDVTADGLRATTHGNDSVAVQANIEDSSGSGNASIFLRNGTVIETFGSGAHGALAINRDPGTSLVDVLDSSVTTRGSNAIGAFANAAGGNATLRASNVTVTTNGTNSHGLEARSSGVSGLAEVLLDGGRLTTNGNSAEGLFALSEGSNGTASLRIVSGNVTTHGVDSEGAVAQVGDSNLFTSTNGSARVVMEGGTITTTGLGSAGILAQGDLSLFGSSDVFVSQGGGLIQTTGGALSATQSSAGIVGLAFGAGSATINQDGGAVLTAGSFAHGVYAVSIGGDALVSQARGASIMATSGDADGIHVSTLSGLIGVDVNGLTHGGAYGINASATAYGGAAPMSITIGANGVVEGGVAAIRAAASSQDIAIANFGTVRNVSQASSALAVDAVATGRLTLRNTGLVLGTVRLDGAATSLTNLTGAIWNTAGGTNQMGANAAANRVENQAGATVIAAAAGAGGPVTTTFNGLGEFANAGLVQLQNRVAGDRLMINGSYSGAGGTISLDTYLGGDASATDLVRITGNTSGSSLLRVANVGGPGAPTVEGIKVVDVGGASNGVFTLLGDYNLSGQPAVIGGAYAYTLQKNGISASSDGDWYLRSTLTVSPQPPQPPQPQEPQPQQPGEPQPQQPQQPGIPQPQAPSPQPLPIWQPGAPLYETMPRVALDFMQMLTLQQRVGNRFWPGRAETAPGGAGSGATAEGNGIWGRIDGSFSRSDPGRSTTDAHASQRMWRGEIGADFLGWSGAAGILTGGLTVHYGQVLADINSPWGRGSNRTTGYGLGATATWYGTGGFYADAQGRLSWLSTDLNSETLARRMGKDVEGLGHALSLELGQRFGASHDFQLIPQAQLSWTGVRYDRFVDPYGAFVSAGDGQSLQGRLGLAVQREQQWTDASGRARRASVYGIANLYHEFLDGLSVKVSGARLANREARTWAGVGVGGTYNLNGDALSLYGEIQAAANVSGSGDSYRLSGKAGLRVRW